MFSNPRFYNDQSEIVCDMSFSFLRDGQVVSSLQESSGDGLEKRGYFQVGNPLQVGLSAPTSRAPCLVRGPRRLWGMQSNTCQV